MRKTCFERAWWQFSNIKNKCWHFKQFCFNKISMITICRMKKWAWHGMASERRLCKGQTICMRHSSPLFEIFNCTMRTTCSLWCNYVSWNRIWFIVYYICVKLLEIISYQFYIRQGHLTWEWQPRNRNRQKPASGQGD